MTENQRKELESIASPLEFLRSADGKDEPSPCVRVYKEAILNAYGESFPVRLQIKVRAIERLAKLEKKGRISKDEFEHFKRLVQSI